MSEWIHVQFLREIFDIRMCLERQDVFVTSL